MAKVRNKRAFICKRLNPNDFLKPEIMVIPMEPDS